MLGPLICLLCMGLLVHYPRNTALLTAAVFRYNILSLVNLLLFLFSLLLPGPRLKARKGGLPLHSRVQMYLNNAVHH